MGSKKKTNKQTNKKHWFIIQALNLWIIFSVPLLKTWLTLLSENKHMLALPCIVICKLLAAVKHLEILLYINLDYFQSDKLIKTAGQRIFLNVVRENKEGKGSLRTNHALATSLHIPAWFWQGHWEMAVSVFFIASMTTQQGTMKLAKFLNDEWK